MKMIVIIKTRRRIGQETRLFSTISLSLLCAIGAALSGQAQSGVGSGVLRGLVLDPNRAAIVRARVAVLGTKGTPVITDDKGEFSLTLPPGQYTLTAEAEGFARVFAPSRRKKQPGKGAQTQRLTMAGIA